VGHNRLIRLVHGWHSLERKETKRQKTLSDGKGAGKRFKNWALKKESKRWRLYGKQKEDFTLKNQIIRST